MSSRANLKIWVVISLFLLTIAGNAFSEPITSYPYAEGFESGFGEWINITGDDTDWTQRSGSTTSSATGPTSAYEGIYYLYIESSSPHYPNKIAILEGPAFDVTSLTNAELSFWYHMYGSTMGTLSVEISDDDGANWATEWALSGNQSNVWYEAVVDISSYTGIILVRFVGQTGSSYTSDMAIDEVEIIGTTTPPVIISGYVETSNNEAIESVTLTADNGGGSDVTDIDGYYEVTVPYAWSGTVTPSKGGWSFNPSNQAYSNVTTDLTDEDYIAAEVPVLISGYVQDDSYNGIEGVLLLADNNDISDTTDSNGYYELAAPYNWSGTVTPIKSCYAFDPVESIYTSVISDMNDESYTASLQVIFVDANASGANDGASWSDAYNELYDGLNVASANDAIWVAEGTYRPDTDGLAEPRDATFALIGDVDIYGGFPMGGCALEQRDPNTYKTILSGDINDNDVNVADPEDLLDEPTRADNCYHVVTGNDGYAKAVLDGFTITGGNADGYNSLGDGAGMYCVNGYGTLTTELRNCTFTANAAYDEGGGICNYSQLKLTDCVFTGNWARDGGGIYNNNYATIVACTFISNAVTSNGGGIYNRYADGPVTDCIFSCNLIKSSGYAGGMYNYQCSPMVTNCLFSGNSKYGIYNYSSSNPTINNCTFNSNGYGGMKNSYQSSPSVNECTFNNNWLYNYNQCSPTVINCIFYGEGITNRQQCDSELTNCVFSGCGITNDDDSSPLLTNCTVSTTGSAITNYSGCNPTLTNCILWGGEDEIIRNYSGASVTVTYSDVQGGWPGTGNIDSDPMFMDAIGADGAAGTEDDNLHLLPGSACVDAGNNDMVPVDVNDADGDPRILDDPATPDTGYPPSADAIVDMGAYENPKQGLLLSARAVVVNEGTTEGFTVVLIMDPNKQVEVTTACISGDPDITIYSGGILTFDSSNYWIPQLVSIAAAEDDDRINGNTIVHVSADGFYTVPVTATEADNEPEPDIIHVDINATGANNGWSWTDAYNDLQDALTEARAYPQFDEIRVAQGFYRPTETGYEDETFDLVSGVAVKGGYAGSGAPDPSVRDINTYKSILSGSGEISTTGYKSYHVVTSTDCDETTLLEGFTVTGGCDTSESGYEAKGGGICCINSSITIAECIITKNSAVGLSYDMQEDAYGGGIYCEGGSPTISGCVITENYVFGSEFDSPSFGENSGGSAYGGGICFTSNCDANVIDCVIRDNDASGGNGIYAMPEYPNGGYGGTGSGGGMYIGYGCDIVISNCIIADNYVTAGDGGRGAEGMDMGGEAGDGGNGGDAEGGGIRILSNSTVIIEQCKIIGNSCQAGNGGEGGYAMGPPPPEPPGPPAGDGGDGGNGCGGAVYCGDSNPNVAIRNCFVGENWVSGGIGGQGGSGDNAGDGVDGANGKTSGAGINAEYSAITVANCTFTDNSAENVEGQGGGIYLHNVTEPLISNCIFKNNSKHAVYLDMYSPDLILGYCLFYDNPDGDLYDLDTLTTYTGAIEINLLPLAYANINGDPLIRPDGHLQAVSQCIDSGDPCEAGTDQLDIDCETRVVNGIVEIGCDEFVDSDGDGLPDWWEKCFFDSNTACDPAADNDGDGHTNLTEYNTGSNPLGDYYVNCNSGNDLWDGISQTWDGKHGPKATIQAVINTASDTDTIIVAPGHYTGDKNRNIDFCGKAITLRSTDPTNPLVVANTIIDCESGHYEDMHRGFIFNNGEDADSLVSGFSITGGHSGYYNTGGAILCIDSSPTISHCIISENDGQSGVVYCENSSPTIANCIIRDNGSYDDAIYCVDNSAPTIINSIIKNNDIGLYCLDSSPVVSNCTIVDNSTGIYCRADTIVASPTITNCVLQDNTKAISENGDLADPTVTYCCFHNNAGGDWYDYDSSTTLTGAVAINTLPEASANIDDDPLMTVNGHLQKYSSCIDAGDPCGIYTSQSDIDDEQRVANSYIDIGADEFIDSDDDGLPDWWELWYYASATAAEPTADDDSDGKNNLFEYCESTNPLGNYYVDTDHGNDLWDGLSQSWDGSHGPKATIQTAINMASNGDTVIIAPGVYKGYNNRNISFDGKAIIVRGTNPDDQAVVEATIINGQANQGILERAFCFDNGEDTNSVLSGISITNCYSGYSDRGVIYCKNTTPTISHCIINNNQGTGIGIYNCATGPTVTNCTITESTGSYAYGIYCYYAAGNIIDCNISNNLQIGINCGNSSSPTISGCTINDNIGSGIYCSYSSNPNIKNCSINGNSNSGVSCYNGAPVASNCIITNNDNGVYCGTQSIEGSIPLINNCIISDNSNGVYFYRTTTGLISNCMISRNNTGIYCYAPSGTFAGEVINSIIMDSNEYGVYEDGEAADPNVSYCLLYNNSTGDWYDYDSLSILNGAAAINVLPEAHDNITEDPLLMVDGYHLQPASPCIDAGYPGGDYTGQVDIDGQPRVLCDRVDIGVDESFFVDEDFYPDNRVDFRDFAVFASAWRSEDGDGNWNPACDLADPKDGIINELDLAKFTSNWLAGVE